jgi:thioredoxin reductase (NADPH)
VTARKVLLATGVTNRKPPMDPELHDAALAQGLIRYCPVCDGYEVTDKKVGVIGSGSHGGRGSSVHSRVYRGHHSDRAGSGS